MDESYEFSLVSYADSAETAFRKSHVKPQKPLNPSNEISSLTSQKVFNKNSRGE